MVVATIRLADYPWRCGFCRANFEADSRRHQRLLAYLHFTADCPQVTPGNPWSVYLDAIIIGKYASGPPEAEWANRTVIYYTSSEIHANDLIQNYGYFEL